MERAKHMLDYLATHPDTKSRHFASDVILNIRSDASYLSEPRATSRLAWIFFLESKTEKGENIKMNRNICVSCGVLGIVVCSAADTELGARFLNITEGKMLRLALEELGHSQFPMPIHYDNSTVTGTANNSVKDNVYA